MISTFSHEAPVARTASTCFMLISSIASAKSLAMKPIDDTMSARMPASAPKPTAFTNRMATIMGWNERHSAISTRPTHDTQAGARLRAAISPMGMARRMPTAVARMAICTDSSRPSLISSSLSAAKFGGHSRSRNLAPWPRPRTKRSQVNCSVVIA